MSFELSALDGANPLAFLASLGALRLLGDKNVKMRWVRRGVWRPELSGCEKAENFSEGLAERAVSELPAAAFQILGKNITVSPECFASFVEPAFEDAKAGDRKTADFACAFGSEVIENKERIVYTDLCFITGSGHQHFLGTVKTLSEKVTGQHIEDALFGNWETQKGLSMRWDPSDAAEYALQWGDPSAEGAWSVWGANLLAFHALPLFPSQPLKKGLRTTGFRREVSPPEFTWPIWSDAISLDTVRSLLSLEGLHDWENRLNHQDLRAMGIVELYRSPRVRIGQGGKFKSFRAAKAV